MKDMMDLDELKAASIVDGAIILETKAVKITIQPMLDVSARQWVFQVLLPTLMRILNGQQATQAFTPSVSWRPSSACHQKQLPGGLRRDGSIAKSSETEKAMVSGDSGE